MKIAVRTQLEAYRVAIAELPLRTVATATVSGAVVAVGGAGAWWEAASDALAGGAAGVVIAHPGDAPVAAVDELMARAATTPIVVERPLLRADAVALVRETTSTRGAPAAVAIECHAPAHELRPTLRDAIGWGRVLARTPLRRTAGATHGDRALALLETTDGVAVSVVAATQVGSAGRLRITALAEARVELDGDAGLVLTLTDVSGRRTLPTRFERPERVALRAVVDAVQGRGRPADLAELRQDAALADEVLATSRP